MNEATLRMITLAGQGFFCSQILLSMGLEAQGKSNPDLIRAMAGLAGGLGFTGDTCGALTGGACLLSLYAGKGLPEEQEDEKLNLMISELVTAACQPWLVRVSGCSSCCRANVPEAWEIFWQRASSVSERTVWLTDWCRTSPTHSR